MTDPKIQKLMEQGRKKAWASWNMKTWRTALAHINYSMEIVKDSSGEVESISATRGDSKITGARPEGYHSVRYAFERAVVNAGIQDEFARAAGLPTVEESKTAKKQRTGENGIGICQCCFRGFKTGRGTVAKHGYERPGFGYLIGRCRGENHLPYEISCDQTKVFLAETKAALATATESLRRLTSGETKMILAQTRTSEVYYDAKGYRRNRTKLVEVRKGDEAVIGEGGYNTVGYVPSWNDVYRDAVRNTKSLISQLGDQDKFLTEMVATWKFSPLPGFEGYAPKA